MVGDWVADALGIPMQVISVGYTYAYAENVYDYDWVEFEDKECKPCPILLTDEFFERNNFDEDVPSSTGLKGGASTMLTEKMATSLRLGCMILRPVRVQTFTMCTSCSSSCGLADTLNWQTACNCQITTNNDK